MSHDLLVQVAYWWVVKFEPFNIHFPSLKGRLEAKRLKYKIAGLFC